jgi:superfamily II DNA/RNA helicase
VSGGFEPLKALEAFRDGKATMLLATVNSARGLDLQVRQRRVDELWLG